MTIDEIYKREEISVRSYNVCKDNGLHSVSDLKRYYHQNNSFEKLRNCGRKSHEELIDICNKYLDEFFENRETELKKENSLKTILSELTRVQREVINSFILVNTNSLTVRSRNAISMHLKNNFKVKNFTEKILLSEIFNVKNVKNVGARSIPEIEIYISIIKDFIIEVIQKKDERQLISLKNTFLIQRTFSVSKIPNEILETESIFLLTNFLLNNNVLFDETRTIIVKRAFKIYNNQKQLSLDEIANIIKLTRERVRQIRVFCLEDLFNKLTFIQNFNDDLFKKYNIDANSDFIEINKEIVDTINTLNKINLSQEFITYILFVYFSNRFSLIGDIDDVLLPKYFNARNRHNWNNFYLINNEVASEIDFVALANDINKRINERIEDSYTFNFKSYLSKFLTKNNIEVLDIAFPIAEKIINDEFELYLDLDENFTFKRNTVKQAYEYSYNALEQLGKPSNVSEIYKKILEIYPNYSTDEDKVRSSMKRTNRFTPISRESMYGLKKWENELDNFKGGTIKDIIIEFLHKNEEPVHIVSVLEHLNQFRENKDEKSVISNLKVDPKKRFLIYPQGFIGLQNNKKLYNIKYNKLPIQLGKTIIAKHKKGHSISDIKSFLRNSYDLTFEESKLIINNLKYFNENKRN